MLDFENREIGRVYGDCSQVYRNYPNELKNYCSKMNAKLQAREVLIRKNLAAKKSRLYSILSLNEQNREEAAYACPDLN